MRVMIAVPCFDKVDTAFCNSLIFLKKSADDGLVFNVSSLIYDARNQLAEKAISLGAEYILWLDSDMHFEADLLDRLMESIEGRDFVSGLYFKRRPPYKPCLFKTLGYKQGEAEGELVPIAETYDVYPRREIFEVDGCGFGAVLMRTAMVKDIFDHQGLPFAPVLGFGEDLSFCLRARKAGYKLYCDSSIKLGHTANIVVGEDIYMGFDAMAKPGEGL